ncbi:MAG TPA: helix-turn-helix domain-containing protein [Actinomycetales bacterium]|nr:helix-turn-helix domain-containing protein [Actinomycetales bacterium]
MPQKLSKGIRISGEKRSEVAASIKERYLAGETIRSIAADVGRSYGFVHGLLREQEVPLRARGGDTRSKKATAAAPKQQ